MKKNFIIYLCLFVSLIFWYSCSKDLEPFPKEDNNNKEIKFDIEDARAYFENNATDLSPLTFTQTPTKSIGTSTVDLKPQWEIAIKSGHKNVSLIEIPISSSTLPLTRGFHFEKGKYRYSRQMVSLRRLIIAKTIEGNIDMFVITIVPNVRSSADYAAKLNDFRYLGGSDFTGHVFCSTLEGQLVKGFAYVKGANIGVLPFKLKEDLTDEMNDNIQDKNYISYSFSDIAKTKVGTYSFDEGGGGGWNGDMGTVIVPGGGGGDGWNNGDMGTVIIPGGGGSGSGGNDGGVKCIWCNNKVCTCTVCTRCREKMRDCTCYQYPPGGGGSVNPPTDSGNETEKLIKQNAPKASKIINLKSDLTLEQWKKIEAALGEMVGVNKLIDKIKSAGDHVINLTINPNAESMLSGWDMTLRSTDYSQVGEEFFHAYQKANFAAPTNANALSREFEAKFYTAYGQYISTGSQTSFINLGSVGNTILDAWLMTNIDNINEKLPTSKMSSEDYENMMRSYKDVVTQPYDKMGYDINYGFDLARDLFLNN